ncbi:hypothetical protein LUZ60_011630 [Juncus effusus]|nr:hypothetical protein LUZ60_018525 [Juncus effusus]KAJ3667253.1 hypothetical protein LUZ60_017993 [Juncus effusus]KAJ3667761.1 hypothetical protein LUZ60_018612 [Juncus effusus]KAJ3667762.1 hypothetical protein LUZ60_018613 [Juncus effusus]KAJ3668129.1 hypothetical protein LUZ60_017923 [Juncus effusus]
MSTTGRGRHSVLRIFKGRRGRTGHRATCGALPAAGPYLRLSRFQGGQADRLTHVQVPFTWNLSPLRPSKFSFEYLLLPPRSAPTAAPPGLTPRVLRRPPRPPTHRGMEVARWPGVGRALQRHPFSGLVDSADERFARQYRFGPPPEFPLASPRSGIVHHLSGPDRHAPTRTLHRRSGSASGDYPLVSFLAPPGFPHPSTRTHVRLLGPCFKTGRMGSPQADAYACRAAGAHQRAHAGFAAASTAASEASPGFGRRHGRQRSATRDKRHGGPQVRPIPSPSGSHRRPPSASLPAISSTL